MSETKNNETKSNMHVGAVGVGKSTFIDDIADVAAKVEENASEPLGRGDTEPILAEAVDESENSEDTKGGMSSLGSMSITDMANSLDEIGRSLELQRQMFEGRSQLEQVCFALGIKKDDQDHLDKKFTEYEISKKDIEKWCESEERLNKKFFTREDGSIIKVESPNSSEYDTKKELVSYLWEFYDLEKSVKHEIDEMQADMKTFRNEEVASASATVANNLVRAIAERRAELPQIEDETERKSRERLIDRMESSYTFKEILDVINKYPSVVRNALSDFRTPDKVVGVGKRYREKLQQANTFSNLYGAVVDDITQSIEAQFLHEDDYVKGSENFFVFFLIRSFSMETWTDKKEFTKEYHNATVIVITNLMRGTLNTEFRDQVVEGIKAVWAALKERWEV